MPNEITNKRESGYYSSFCPLSCISWLTDKLDDAFFLVLGTQSCAFFIQTPRPLRLLNNTHSGTIVMEESEVCMGINENKLLGYIEKVLKKYSPKILFLIGSCFVEVQKIDLEHLAEFVQKNTGVNIVPVDISGFYPSFSNGEDILLSNLSDLCPKSDGHEKELVIVGAIPDKTRKDFEKLIKNLRIPFGGFLPMNDVGALPKIGENTLLAPLSPYLGQTLNRLKRIRKSKVLTSLFPIGPYGTRNFFEEICKEFNLECDSLKKLESDTWDSIIDDVNKLKGMKAFFIGDSLLELPLARFLLACSVDIVELSTPFLNKIIHKKEEEFLNSKGISIIEAPDNRRQLESVRKIKPDMVISPLSLSYPLKALGLKPVWSVKFFRPETSFYGFEQCDILVKTFVNSLRE